MSRLREILEHNRIKIAERRRARQERVEKTRAWKKEKPRPLKDILLALSKVLMWAAILVLVWYLGPLLKLLKLF